MIETSYLRFPMKWHRILTHQMRPDLMRDFSRQRGYIFLYLLEHNHKAHYQLFVLVKAHIDFLNQNSNFFGVPKFKVV